MVQKGFSSRKEKESEENDVSSPNSFIVIIRDAIHGLPLHGHFLADKAAVQAHWQPSGINHKAATITAGTTRTDVIFGRAPAPTCSSSSIYREC